MLDLVLFATPRCGAERCCLDEARLRIRAAQRGEIPIRNEPGELYIGINVTIENYVNFINEEDMAFYTDKEGTRWFRTGELATINDGEIIYVLIRLKGVTKRSCIPNQPATVESTIGNFTDENTVVLA